MAKPILFVVHGMGKHKSGWHKEINNALGTALGHYSFFDDSTLNSWVKIVPITYDDEFEKLRKLWKDDAAKVVKKMQQPDSRDKYQLALSRFEADKLLELQTELGTDSFFNTHVLDVLLYRFTALGEKIRVKVAKSIVSTLMAESGEVPSWAVMAHSLGTSVTHDTLHALYADKIWREGKVKKLFVPGQYTASCVIMLANVSRVLQSRAKAYKSRVKPGNGGMCDYFINAYHQLDPFPRVKQFDPGDEWLGGQNTEELYSSISINVINQPNVHAYTHYLENPKVHVPVFRSLIGEIAISNRELKKAYDDFFQNSPNATYRDLRNRLENLNIGEPESFQALLETWKRFSDILDDYKDQIGSLG